MKIATKTIVLLTTALALGAPSNSIAFPVHRISAEITRAVYSGKRPVAVVDLDETVLHSTRRHILSYRAAVQRNLAKFSARYPMETQILLRTTEIKQHELLMSLPNRYDLKAWLGRMGIQNELFRLELNQVSLPIYLSQEFMHLDRAYHGAQALLDLFYRSGGEVYFVSSRYRTQQYDATVHRLILSRLYRSSRYSHVVLREDGEASLDFKVRAFNQIRRATQDYHQVVLVAENEPENLNAMIKTFPAAIPVYVVGAILNTTVSVSPAARLIRTKTYSAGLENLH